MPILLIANFLKF